MGLRSLYIRPGFVVSQAILTCDSYFCGATGVIHVGDSGFARQGVLRTPDDQKVKSADYAVQRGLAHSIRHDSTKDPHEPQIIKPKVDASSAL